MARRIFKVSPNNPYHISGRCLNKEWFAVPMPEVWRILCDYLYFAHHAFDLKIHSFVLMSNHFHMLVSSPLGNISPAMQYFMKETSRALAIESKRINHIWGARFSRSEITSHHYFLNAYKYVYRNPVRSGMETRVEDYPYSTLNALVGEAKLTIPLVNDFTLFSDIEGTLRWLNTPAPSEFNEAMSRALRRKVFQLPKLDSRSHPLENDLL